MKALDHYGKADRLEGQQAVFDAASFSEAIINLCHAAAYHLVCAGLEWQGVDPQSYGHAHSKHPSRLKQVSAPSAVQAAWGKLEQLRSKALYGAKHPSKKRSMRAIIWRRFEHGR